MLEAGVDSGKRSGQSRNRQANRRNSRDRLDRMHSLGENGGGPVGGGPGGSSGFRANGALGINSSGIVESLGAESHQFSYVAAAQVMTERWTATINALTNPSVDISERPVLYESGSAWGTSKLPFQVSVSDFLHEVGQAVLRSNQSRASVREYSLF